ncbi:MAG: Mth938-like domain-containing protein [Gammaproteobacteria bacterium]
MLLTQDSPQGKYQIRNYQPGSITINDTVYTESLIVTLTTLITPWPPRSVAELSQAHLTPLLELHPAIVLLGTGPSGKFLSPALLAPLFNQQIGVEVMDTAAACRTFTVLTAEGRNVAAALLIE